MTRQISANLKAEIQSGAPNVATCWKIERTDGTILGFTTWSYSFDYSGTTYQPIGGYQRTALDQREGMNVDNMDIVGLLDSGYITETDLLAGKYRGAKLWIFMVSPDNLGWGDMDLDYGYLGEVHLGRVGFVVEFRSLMMLASQEFGNKFSRYCRHQLGDSNVSMGIEYSCGIELEPSDWAASTAYSVNDVVMPTTKDGRRYVCTTAGTSDGTEPTWDTTIGNTTADNTVTWTTYKAYMFWGTVTGVTSKFKFTDTSRTEPDNDFKYGVMTWITGDNAGVTRDVKSSTALGVIETRRAAPFTIQVGDTYKMHVGCNHILKMPSDTLGSAYTGDCRAKFNLEAGGNAKNFGGEPELPNLDRISTPADRAT